jgi:PIN domain nuclease of toxin-antitoxin system
MTALKVVDASALAAFLFAETDSAEVAARLQGATLLAPIMLDLKRDWFNTNPLKD